MKKIFTIILAVCGICTVVAQAPEIEWQKTLGGSSVDYALSGQQTIDGGYIVAGVTWSHDGDVSNNNGNVEEAWIAKLDSSGVLQWEKSLGSALNIHYMNHYATSIYQTADNGYIIAGQTGGTGNFWIVKINNSGDIEWHKSLGGTSSERAEDIQQTTDGGYIVVGHSDYDYWIVKLNSIGDLQWEKKLGGSGIDKAYSVRQTTDGGYVIAGSSASDDGDVTGHHGLSFKEDYWIVKLDSVGDLEWQKSLGGTSNDIAYSVRQTTDGGYIIAGSSSSNDGDVTGNHGNTDCWIVKLNDSGVIEWQRTLGGSSGDGANSINLTEDGGYIVAGYSYSTDGDVVGNYGNLDYWVVKLNNSGAIQWNKNLGGTEEDRAWSVNQTSDGGYFIIGYTNSNDGDITEYKGSSDFWIVKLAPDTMSVTDYQLSEFEIYPNPTKDIVNFNKEIDGKLFNQAGQEVLSFKNASYIDVSDLAKGIYVLQTAEGVTKRIIIQ